MPPFQSPVSREFVLFPPLLLEVVCSQSVSPFTSATAVLGATATSGHTHEAAGYFCARCYKTMLTQRN